MKEARVASRKVNERDAIHFRLAGLHAVWHFLPWSYGNGGVFSDV